MKAGMRQILTLLMTVVLLSSVTAEIIKEGKTFANLGDKQGCHSPTAAVTYLCGAANVATANRAACATYNQKG
ncbi:hypothetical protein SeMB42_g00851 [Synchytrium endobioticum]|uniref:Uncharacterized protein n=1 Tax=Synchytrium endobioticum TaxID=286115 RepID=A0A507DBV0_9FUNG|nr:hypothetical protein SeLEV6574_g01816 [Synchytrium endobioticum]TPX53370.1 hypothetical protein SeMB42_g00851 [Synchytrium endobioticum]